MTLDLVAHLAVGLLVGSMVFFAGYAFAGFRYHRSVARAWSRLVLLASIVEHRLERDDPLPGDQGRREALGQAKQIVREELD